MRRGGGPRERAVHVHVVIEDEKILSAVLHDVFAQVLYEVGNGDSLPVLVVGGNVQFVYSLV